MDEVLFHISQTMESLQVHVYSGAQQTRLLLLDCSGRAHQMAVTLWATPHGLQIHAAVSRALAWLAEAAEEARAVATETAGELYARIMAHLAQDMTRAGLYFGCVGFVVGGVVGVSVGLSWRRSLPTPQRVKAVVCTGYEGVDALCLVDDFPAPSISRPDEVLIRVKAASVDPVDLRVCSGYARLLRFQLNRHNKNVVSPFPVVLGRDCAGVVMETGCRVSKLLPGDEVWLCVPPWAPGTLAETIVVREHEVFRKPRAVGFETAASLPCAGVAAWDAITRQAGLSKKTCAGKRVLVREACSPVGCVLLQLARLWGAHVTATCRMRATPVAQALGADLVVATETGDAERLAELEPFHVVFHTAGQLSMEASARLCVRDGLVVDTTAPRIRSDSLGFPLASIYSLWVRLRSIFMSDPASQWIGRDSGAALDALCLLVEDGSLQPVVDKIYSPQDAELAFAHVGSADAIGKTVIRFRARNLDKSRSSSQCKKPDNSSSA